MFNQFNTNLNTQSSFLPNELNNQQVKNGEQPYYGVKFGKNDIENDVYLTSSQNKKSVWGKVICWTLGIGALIGIGIFGYNKGWFSKLNSNKTNTTANSKPPPPPPSTTPTTKSTIPKEQEELQAAIKKLNISLTDNNTGKVISTPETITEALLTDATNQDGKKKIASVILQLYTDGKSIKGFSPESKKLLEVLINITQNSDLKAKSITADNYIDIAQKAFNILNNIDDTSSNPLPQNNIVDDDDSVDTETETDIDTDIETDNEDDDSSIENSSQTSDEDDDFSSVASDKSHNEFTLDSNENDYILHNNDDDYTLHNNDYILHINEPDLQYDSEPPEPSKPTAPTAPTEPTEPPKQTAPNSRIKQFLDSCDLNPNFDEILKQINFVNQKDITINEEHLEKLSELFVSSIINNKTEAEIKKFLNRPNLKNEKLKKELVEQFIKQFPTDDSPDNNMIAEFIINNTQQNDYTLTEKILTNDNIIKSADTENFGGLEDKLTTLFQELFNHYNKAFSETDIKNLFYNLAKHCRSRFLYTMLKKAIKNFEPEQKQRITFEFINQIIPNDMEDTTIDDNNALLYFIIQDLVENYTSDSLAEQMKTSKITKFMPSFIKAYCQNNNININIIGYLSRFSGQIDDECTVLLNLVQKAINSKDNNLKQQVYNAINIREIEIKSGTTQEVYSKLLLAKAKLGIQLGKDAYDANLDDAILSLINNGQLNIQKLSYLSDKKLRDIAESDFIQYTTSQKLYLSDKELSNYSSFMMTQIDEQFELEYLLDLKISRGLYQDDWDRLAQVIINNASILTKEYNSDKYNDGVFNLTVTALKQMPLEKRTEFLNTILDKINNKNLQKLLQYGQCDNDKLLGIRPVLRQYNKNQTMYDIMPHEYRMPRTTDRCETFKDENDKTMLGYQGTSQYVETSLTQEQIEYLFGEQRPNGNQHQTGNCWLVSELKHMMYDPQLKLYIMNSFSMDDNGNVSITLKNGKKVTFPKDIVNKASKIVEEDHLPPAMACLSLLAAIQRTESLSETLNNSNLKAFQEDLTVTEDLLKEKFSEVNIPQGYNIIQITPNQNPINYALRQFNEGGNSYRDLLCLFFDEVPFEQINENSDTTKSSRTCIKTSGHAWSVYDDNLAANPQRCNMLFEKNSYKFEKHSFYYIPNINPSTHKFYTD